jgi:putative peptide maturation dehydrogenase
MARVRRTRYLAFSCQDELLPDLPAILRGVARLAPVRSTRVISILRGEEYRIAPEELAVLLEVPSDHWVESDGIDSGVLDRLVQMGAVLTNEEEESLAEFVRRDDVLRAGEWNLYGALYHFLTKWRDVDLGMPPGDDPDPALFGAIDEFVALHGPPPPAFSPPSTSRPVHELPLVERRDGLYEALGERKTTRGFDGGARMTTEELATVLYYVFGCHGYAEMAGKGHLIKRTSPSGGGLHAIEVYPLVRGVDGIDPGLYHYNVRDHTLELVADLDAAEIDDTANEFVCGQRYFASAHALFVMTARFYRSFWKYRRSQKAYGTLLMDAGHLSQTLYLVAAELGLGAYVTAAVNGANIEERLGIDGWTEGVLAVSGCGRRGRRRAPLEPNFVPYVPRETVLPGMGVDGRSA